MNETHPPLSRRFNKMFYRQKLVNADIYLLKKNKLSMIDLAKDIGNLGKDRHGTSYVGEYLKTSPLKIKNLNVYFVQNLFEEGTGGLLDFLNELNIEIEGASVKYHTIPTKDMLEHIYNLVDSDNQLRARNYLLTSLTAIDTETPIV